MTSLKNLIHTSARRFLSLFGFLFVLSMGLTSTAHAQVIQPTYVRPAKGAPITLANVTASSVAATYTTSAIFDWSAFAGVVVTVNATGPSGTFTACRYGVGVKSLGGTSTAASDFFLLNVANNDYRAAYSQAWYVRVLPGYLRFVIGTYEAAAAGQPSCTYRVTATPLPFDYAGDLVSTGVVTGYIESSTDDIVITPTLPYVRLQNLDTSAAYCATRGVTGAYNFGRPMFVLKADSTGSTGDGGVVEINNWVGTIRCTSSSPNVIYFAH